MSFNNNCSKKHIPEPGRGFKVCDCDEELRVEPVEGCYKLHETPWLEEYPDNIPTDIFEVRFKNTRRSYYKNVNNLQLKRGDIVAVEARIANQMSDDELHARATRTIVNLRLEYLESDVEQIHKIFCHESQR